MSDVVLSVYHNRYGEFAALPSDRIVAEAFARHGCYEQATVDFLRDRCFPDGVGTYVDAGAHIGLTAIPVALRHPGVQCYAFEPEPLNFQLLELNRDRNRALNLTTIQRALSDRIGSTKMIRDLGRTFDHRMVRGNSASPGLDGEAARPLFDVETTRLYAALAGLDIARPLVLKLDVQGHELAALHGAADLAASHGAADLKPDVVVFEYWPYALMRESVTLADCTRAFADYPFGALLVESSAQLVEGLLLKLLQTIPWDGCATTAIQLVASRTRLMPKRKPLTFYVVQLTGLDAAVASISNAWAARRAARHLLATAWASNARWIGSGAPEEVPLVIVLNGQRFQVRDQRGAVGPVAEDVAVPAFDTGGSR